jgi:Flp pilus assembly protein TadD
MIGSMRPSLKCAAIALTCSASLLMGGCSSGTSLLPDSLMPAAVEAADVQPATSAATPAAKAADAVPGTVRASSSFAMIGKPSLSRARELKASGKTAEAFAMLEAASAAAPNDRHLIIEQGLMALELGQMARARTLLTSADAATDSDWRIVSGLGIAQAGLGDQVEARKSFTRALELSPNNPTVLNNLGLTYMLDGKLDQASTMLRRAASKDQAKPTVSRNVAIVTALKGESTAPADAVSPSELTESQPRIEDMPEAKKGRSKSSALIPPPSGLGRGSEAEKGTSP